MRVRFAAWLGAVALLAGPSSLFTESARASGEFPRMVSLISDPFLWAAPEGIAVDKTGNVFVSVFAPSPGIVPWAEPWADQIWKFSPSGAKSVFTDFGRYGLSGCGRCGLAVDAEGNVYLARTAWPDKGVFRVDRDGNPTVDATGKAVPYPGTEEMVFPDGLAFDQRGNLYVTELFTMLPDGFGQGGIWRISKDGTAAPWLFHDLLTGVGPTISWYPCGANGIRFYNNALYVANTDKATVLRVPVLPDGSPGEPEVWAHAGDVPESPLYGSPFPVMIDGLEMDVLGNVYLPMPSRLAVVRINAKNRSQETVTYYPREPIDAPLSLAFGTGKGERQNLFITNSGMFRNMFGPPWPGSSVVKIGAGIPGLPLP